jgi:hypothetical protein
MWKKGPLKTDCAEKWEERVALPPWERRVSCLIEPSEAALVTLDFISNKRGHRKEVRPSQ